jgi:hypothetical protein
MRVYHFDTDTLLLLTQKEGSYIVQREGDQQADSFKDLSSALWYIIEKVRSIALSSIKDREVKQVAKKLAVDMQPSKQSLMGMLKQRKMQKIFYDTAFLNMVTHHHSNKKYDLILENSTNFFLYDEIVHIIKTSTKEIPDKSLWMA